MTTEYITLFIGGMRGWQLIVIIVLGLLLFGGAKKIPEMMRNLGKGVHSFKQGIEDAKEEMNKPVIRRGKDSDENADSEETHTGKDKS